jgi:hypothetical protein
LDELVKSFTVKEGDKQQGVVIAMTPEEARDKSYVDYMELAQREKVSDALRKAPEKEAPKHSKAESVGALKEFNESKKWHEANPTSRKYYGGF